jgi:uncharacterized membrane protein
MSLDDLRHIDAHHLEETPRYIGFSIGLIVVGIALIIIGLLFF